jgi:MoaA/NifB/PqqE/SkfB family radical SAM enzyme
MKLFCKLPFTRISIDDDGFVWPACCPDWVAFPLGNVFTQSWEEIWHGDAATVFRDSMYDGSLRFCEKNWCPHVADAEAGIRNETVVPYQKAPTFKKIVAPVHVNLNYDLSCNLRCPTCRHELIHYRGSKLDKVERLQHFVESNILPHVHSVALTGVGDPFMSKVFRRFLFDFDKNKFPKLKQMHFHTNGLLFDEKTFNKMKGVHHLRLSTDISIDAATKDTYQKVRPPGDWDTLQTNLQFIKGLPQMQEIGVSMVVQQDNYHEMEPFVELGRSLSSKGRFTFVEFKRARQYQHLNDAQYAKIRIEGLPPAAFQEFKEIVTRIDSLRRVHELEHKTPAIRHNLHEFLPAQVPIIQPSAFKRVLNGVNRRIIGQFRFFQS